MRRAWAELRYLKLWLQFFGAGTLIGAISLVILQPSTHQVLMLMASGSVSVVLIAGGVATLGARSRLGQLWPVVAGLVGLGVAGVLTTGLAPALGGLFILAFVYIGLTQRPGTSLAVVPVAAAGWISLNRPLSHDVIARLAVAVSLWILLGELLSRFSAERDNDKRLLSEQATHDALTGLQNRHGLDQLLTEARVGDAIAFIDLDHFKELNDVRGHAAGDRVLAALGGAVRRGLRTNDVAVRYGGEEILILLPRTTLSEATSLLQRLRADWDSVDAALTFSAGVARVDSAGGVEAARQADRALYRAKDQGRNRTETAPRSSARKTGRAASAAPSLEPSRK